MKFKKENSLTEYIESPRTEGDEISKLIHITNNEIVIVAYFMCLFISLFNLKRPNAGMGLS
jgi:hypothetical protein